MDLHHVRLSAQESHHLLRVHRAKEGTPFQATDGGGAFLECVLERIEDGRVVGRIVERREGWGELSGAIDLLVGLPDWPAVEQVVEHAVPLGVSALHLVVTERSGPEGPSPLRLERLGRIARAGLKQSRRSRLPRIEAWPSLAAALQALPEAQRFVADPDGEPFSWRVPENPQADVQLAVGPPGGFSERELETLRLQRF